MICVPWIFALRPSSQTTMGDNPKIAPIFGAGLVNLVRAEGPPTAPELVLRLAVRPAPPSRIISKGENFLRDLNFVSPARLFLIRRSSRPRVPPPALRSKGGLLVMRVLRIRSTPEERRERARLASERWRRAH